MLKTVRPALVAFALLVKPDFVTERVLEFLAEWEDAAPAQDAAAATAPLP